MKEQREIIRCQADVEKLKTVSERMKDKISDIQNSDSRDHLRGLEGELAAQYFSAFDEMILQQKDNFYFHYRNLLGGLYPEKIQ